MGALAVAVEDRRERENHGTVLRQHDALVTLSVGDRGKKRMCRVEPDRLEHCVMQRLMGAGVVSLAPNETSARVEERDELDPRRDQE
jgi:hypothetical protein